MSIEHYVIMNKRIRRQYVYNSEVKDELFINEQKVNTSLSNIIDELTLSLETGICRDILTSTEFTEYFEYDLPQDVAHIFILREENTPKAFALAVEIEELLDLVFLCSANRKGGGILLLKRIEYMASILGKSIFLHSADETTDSYYTYHGYTYMGDGVFIKNVL